ncbi:hypothetical protein CR203_09235 [Salipaludibacillus neizhouensis]|uniref:Uncharacterized protein n=1 Tax=Salipaludibacillus neizhouensis TaxID=885475 RepID=A0A3A9KAE5_9BACI|nr:hypothetical protein [Salipaludibacillus neizhouensis]RKL67522.1 hypothetical protein CR203_09235 [Salipaludibacillus neizhouensis]
MIKWIGLISSAVIAVTIWGLLLFTVLKDDNVESQESQVELEETVQEELETEKVEEEIEEEIVPKELDQEGPIVSEDTLEIDDNNVVTEETMDGLPELLNSMNIDKKETVVKVVKNGDAIAYGSGVSIDDILEGILPEE